MKMRYSSIDIIYNPASTGPSFDKAKRLKVDLSALYPKVSIHLRATKYAGHAEEIAYHLANSSKTPLIISASGDGGYNEVINGAMRAQKEGATPICAVAPAGNANDHSRTLQNRPLSEGIKRANLHRLDLLEATFMQNRKQHTRYAHSYIGLGLTPVVAVELNKTSLNALKELWIVLKTFYKFRPFKIEEGGKVIKLDSILFANISQMAKVLTIAQKAKPNDGRFEVVKFPHAHKFKLIRKLLKATVGGIEQRKSFTSYTFKVIKKMPVQFDGEVQHIDQNSKVTIEAKKQVLRTII